MGERVHDAHLRRRPGGTISFAGLPRPAPEGSHVVEMNYNGGVRQRARRTVAGGDGGYEPKRYLFVPDVDWGPSLKRLR